MMRADRSKMNEDWDLLVSFLSGSWAELAGETGVLNLNSAVRLSEIRVVSS